MRRPLRTVFVAAAMLALAACGSDDKVTIEISPETTQLVAGMSITFDTTQTIESGHSIDIVGGDNSIFTWTVVEVGGGTVTAGGVYTAPLTTGIFHVKATSKEKPSASATATVTVVSP